LSRQSSEGNEETDGNEDDITDGVTDGNEDGITDGVTDGNEDGAPGHIPQVKPQFLAMFFFKHATSIVSLSCWARFLHFLSDLFTQSASGFILPTRSYVTFLKSIFAFFCLGNHQRVMKRLMVMEMVLKIHWVMQ